MEERELFQLKWVQKCRIATTRLSGCVERQDFSGSRKVYIEALAWKENSALILVYRSAMLSGELKQPGAFELLNKYGYESNDIDSCLKHLKYRLSSCSSFPHEIGVFLGYPLEDVEGFINNKGKNCESCGLWKVYCNKDDKEKLFEKLNKCIKVYQRVFHEGRGIFQMTVCT